jgi:hypothetical protein
MGSPLLASGTGGCQTFVDVPFIGGLGHAVSFGLTGRITPAVVKWGRLSKRDPGNRYGSRNNKGFHFSSLE